jgi:hypothetical protein
MELDGIIRLYEGNCAWYLSSKNSFNLDVLEELRSAILCDFPNMERPEFNIHIGQISSFRSMSFANKIALSFSVKDGEVLKNDQRFEKFR